MLTALSDFCMWKFPWSSKDTLPYSSWTTSVVPSKNCFTWYVLGFRWIPGDLCPTGHPSCFKYMEYFHFMKPPVPGKQGIKFQMCRPGKMQPRSWTYAPWKWTNSPKRSQRKSFKHHFVQGDMCWFWRVYHYLGDWFRVEYRRLIYLGRVPNGSVAGCQFTIPYGLIGTLWKVLVVSSSFASSPSKKTFKVGLSWSINLKCQGTTSLPALTIQTSSRAPQAIGDQQRKRNVSLLSPFVPLPLVISGLCHFATWNGSSWVFKHQRISWEPMGCSWYLFLFRLFGFSFLGWTTAQVWRSCHEP